MTNQMTRPEAINALPTKELFIWILTRDIALVPSIIDLVDNSVDGARNIKGDGPYEGLSVRLNISSREFKISDNCGGISVDTARKYAFRFGRDPEMIPVLHSIGEFGVGMKRSIFKLGNKFSVKCTEATSDFRLDVDVIEWARDRDNWEFEFTDYHENIEHRADEWETTISITNLHDDVIERFKLQSIKSLLVSQIRSKLQTSIDKGLLITVDGIPVETEPMALLSGMDIKPAYLALENTIDGSRVSTQIYCGLGKSDPKMAGWHIFCNGRLILKADKSRITGWGEKGGEIKNPEFHGQFNNARGYVFFESDDPGSLPWNTMKTGINEDSKLYRGAKLQMIRMMRPVIDMLNALKDEKSAAGDDGDTGPLEEIVKDAPLQSLTSIETREVFSTPKPKVKRPPPTPVQRIQFRNLSVNL